MAKLKEGEKMSPLKGVCDTVVRGSGILDFSKPEGKLGTGIYDANYMDISLEFAEEFAGQPFEDNIFLELRLTNNVEALREEGYDEDLISELLVAMDIISNILRDRMNP